MLRSLFVVLQEFFLNPLLVRSPATMSLILASWAPPRMLMGTFWLPLVILISLLGSIAMAIAL